MKVCFFSQRKFAPIAHTIAKYLKELGVEEFCAFTSPRTAYRFLISQKEIPYTKILLDEDIHAKYKNEKIDWQYLAWLEKEYGIPNLWPYIFIDRVIMYQQLIREYPYDKPLLSYEDVIKLLQITAKEIIKFLEEERPDVILMSVVGSLGSMLLYNVGKKMGIKTINIDSNRIRDGIILSEDYRTFSWEEKIFEAMQNGKIRNSKAEEAKNFLEEFRKAPTPYVVDYTPSSRQINRLKQIKFLLPHRFIKTLLWHLRISIKYLFKEKWDYTDEKPWYLIWDKIKRKIRGLGGFSDFYTKPDPNEPYVFFGLHMEPEIATLLYAPFYTDQINLIKQVARSLPINYKLYVKEHPYMVGFRPRKYYRELLKIPNVRIIDPSFSIYDLIKNVKLIITVSGTSGWEGLLFKKPVITFGDVFYNKLSMVKRCRSFEDLPCLIKNQLENFKHDEQELINFIGAILEDSINVDLITLWEKEDQGENIKKDPGLKRLAELIMKKIKESG